MQKINLDLSHFNFFCPVTGIQIASETEFNPSPALKYYYFDGYFIHLSEDSKPLLADLDINLDDETPEINWDNFEIIQNKLASKNLVLFEITTSGVACGPMSSTAYICIDMDYSIDQ
jgi:hypothetical protein